MRIFINFVQKKSQKCTFLSNLRGNRGELLWNVFAVCPIFITFASVKNEKF